MFIVLSNDWWAKRYSSRANLPLKYYIFPKLNIKRTRDKDTVLFRLWKQHLTDLAGQTCSHPAETGKSEQQSRTLMFDAIVDTEVIRVPGSFCPDSTPRIVARLAPSRRGFRGYICVCPSLRMSKKERKGETSEEGTKCLFPAQNAP